MPRARSLPTFLWPRIIPAIVDGAAPSLAKALPYSKTQQERDLTKRLGSANPGARTAFNRTDNILWQQQGRACSWLPRGHRVGNWPQGASAVSRRGTNRCGALAACGGCLLLALQSQSLEHAAIFRVELFFHMDFARRHIDEKIIRMRIDVGDVGDAQLPPALNLTLGVGFIVNYDLQKFGFFSLEVALDGLDHAQRSPLAGPFPLRPLAIDCGRSRQSQAYALSVRHPVLSPDDRPLSALTDWPDSTVLFWE